MPNSAYSVGWRTVVFAAAQSSLKTIAATFPVAADAIRVIAFNVDPKAPIGPRQDAHGTAGSRGPVHQHRTASWSMELYATGGGATGTAADWAQLVTSGGWNVNTPGTDGNVSGASSTTTRIDMGAGETSDWSVGDALVVNNELRRVTAVDSVATDLVVSPPLTSAPGAGDDVKAALVYTPNDDMADNQDSLTIWGFDNNRADRVIGAVVTSLTITASGADDLRMSIEGSAYRADIVHTTTLSAGIDNAVTAIPVVTGLCVPQDVSATLPVYLQIDDEVLEIIGVSGNDLTSSARGVFQSGGAAAAHLSGAETFPRTVDPSYVDVDPISRTRGALIVNSVDLQHGSSSLTVDNGVRFTESSHGQTHSIDHYTLNRREVTMAADGSSEKTTMAVRALEAFNRTSVEGFLTAGNAEGSLLAYAVPAWRPESPSFDRSRDDEISYSFTGPGYETLAAGEDDVFILVG